MWADYAGLLVSFGIMVTGLLSPGPNILAIIGTSMERGRQAGSALACGIAVGSGLWAVLTVLGFSALMATYAGAMIVLKIAGAAYLAWLAFKSFRSAFGPTKQLNATARSDKALFWRGFLIQMTNPKAALMWIATVAVGIGSAAQVHISVLLVVGSFLLSLVGHLAYARAFSTEPVVRFYQRAKRWLDMAFGAFFAFAAFKLATSRS